MRCAFLGTPEFAVPSADALLRSTVCDLAVVITQPNAPSGRGKRPSPPPVAQWAAVHHVALRQPSSTAALREVLQEIQPDIGIVVAYGRIIPPDVLTIPRFGFVNLHPSLLPRWRGPSPIATAIVAGDTETGVTLMLLDAEIDHGPVLAQERIPLSPTETRLTVERELAERGAALLARTLPEYVTGRITPVAQDDAAATFSKILSRDDGRINWVEPAAAVERKIRAYEGWPGTWCMLPNGKRLKVLAARAGGATEHASGIVAPQPDGMPATACGDRTLLHLLRVQPEGKAPMDGSEFLRGARDIMRLT